MQNSDTKYLIFNTATGEHITTYHNENTLNTLDLERCYYITAYKVKPKQTKQVLKYQTEVDYDRKSSAGLSNISSNNPTYGTSLLNPTNIILHSALLADVSSNGYSICGNSSSGSSDNSYSSSSCSSDSSSW